MKAIHFYESGAGIPEPCAHGWDEAEAMVRDGAPEIHTTQMGLLSTRLIEAGYRVFVHPGAGSAYEIRLGTNDCTDKEIRAAHNLFRMWLGGAFSAKK